MQTDIEPLSVAKMLAAVVKEEAPGLVLAAAGHRQDMNHRADAVGAARLVAGHVHQRVAVADGKAV